MSEDFMSLVRLLGFTTMACGCVSGRYREVGTNREVTYIEEKGNACAQAEPSAQPARERRPRRPRLRAAGLGRAS